jgi:hypothetical protein
VCEERPVIEQHSARFRTVYVVLAANVLLLLILLVTLGYVSTLRGKVDATTSQSRTACTRGNLLRAQVNFNSSVTMSFLAQAALTREQTAQHADAEGDPVTAQINRDAAKQYRSLQKGFTPLPLVDCESIYP